MPDESNKSSEPSVSNKKSQKTTTIDAALGKPTDSNQVTKHKSKKKDEKKLEKSVSQAAKKLESLDLKSEEDQERSMFLE